MIRIFFFQNISIRGFLPCRRKANHSCLLAVFYILNRISYIAKFFFGNRNIGVQGVQTR